MMKVKVEIKRDLDYPVGSDLGAEASGAIERLLLKQFKMELVDVEDTVNDHTEIFLLGEPEEIFSDLNKRRNELNMRIAALKKVALTN